MLVCPVADSQKNFDATLNGPRNRVRELELGLPGLGATWPTRPSALKAPVPRAGVVPRRGAAPPCHPAHWGAPPTSLEGNDQQPSEGRVCGLSRSSSPQVIQCGLLPRRDKVFPARLAVNQVDDEVPHDRTPLFDPWVLIAAIRFPVSSRDPENGFVIATEWLMGCWTMKQLHGFAISTVHSRHALSMVQSTTRPSGI